MNVRQSLVMYAVLKFNKFSNGCHLILRKKKCSELSKRSRLVSHSFVIITIMRLYAPNKIWSRCQSREIFTEKGFQWSRSATILTGVMAPMDCGDLSQRELPEKVPHSIGDKTVSFRRSISGVLSEQCQHGLCSGSACRTEPLLCRRAPHSARRYQAIGSPVTACTYRPVMKPERRRRGGLH